MEMTVRPCELGLGGREDVLGVITNVILVIWGPRGFAGHMGSTGGFLALPGQLPGGKILPSGSRGASCPSTIPGSTAAIEAV